MKFGKQIQSQQVPGWSEYYLDYKSLKKIISSLAANRPASEAAALTLGAKPTDILVPSSSPQQSQTGVQAVESESSVLQDGPGRTPLLFPSDQDDERGPDFQAHKAAFFFKLERELEKINAFYLQKEAELKLRLETLLSKRRAAAMRVLPDNNEDSTRNHVEWTAVEEGFRLLERDLGKLEQFIELNATGFRKILKKWDKRSKSSTKELYLARQVDIQPVFNRELISELSDTVAACLMDLTDLSTGVSFEGAAANDVFMRQILSEAVLTAGPFRDLENNLRTAVNNADEASIRELARYAGSLAESNGGRNNVTRILWKIIIDAPPQLADLILSSLATPFDFLYIDDINGRTCLHEAVIAGTLRLVNVCLDKGVQWDKVDVYGRSALHYACMEGHGAICQRLLHTGLSADTLDMDNYSPLIYATLKGSLGCLNALLEDFAVLGQLNEPTGGLFPLSLASRAGHFEVALLLIQHGAKSLPNSNGEYPIHLAAKDGHEKVCWLLLESEGWDTPDKYHEWTPLFHAARHGQQACVELFLSAGSRVDAADELGYLPIHYAAWYGHHRCTTLLLSATPPIKTGQETTNIIDHGPSADTHDSSSDADMDTIPSLSLPPPIMPHRVYGHNYLDRNCLIQICIGTASILIEPRRNVQLDNRLASTTIHDQYLLSSTPLKLVMTSPHVNSAPYAISLPQQDDEGAFSFQIPHMDTFTLEFSIYPYFGTKTIGRNVVYLDLESLETTQTFLFPVLDNRLHVIGEIPFDVTLITPFNGVTLEVGGAVETYWKSMATYPAMTFSMQPMLPAFGQLSSTTGSTHTSPSAPSVVAASTSTSTISSLSGQHVYVVVQVTRDSHPVIYPEWLLPDTGFDIGVGDVTLAQFEKWADLSGRSLPSHETITAQSWHQVAQRCMISLAQLLKMLPANLGVALELAYPSRNVQQLFHLKRKLDLNEFVDAVLRTIYYTSDPNALSRRRFTFTSFSPDVCASLNWKQPNYPVFFSSFCGRRCLHPPSVTPSDIEGENDRRLGSLNDAVEFSKSNNLLGIFVDADILEEVPSLSQAVRSAGLLVGVFGGVDKLSLPSIPGVDIAADAFVHDDVVVYKDHSGYESL